MEINPKKMHHDKQNLPEKNDLQIQAACESMTKAKAHPTRIIFDPKAHIFLLESSKGARQREEQESFSKGRI